MDPSAEASYDRVRFGQWLAGRAHDPRVSRRQLVRLLGSLAAVAGSAPVLAGAAARPAFGETPPIVKPTPADLFYLYGSNAEMRWEAMAGQGYLTPTDRFFVRDHTSTPVIDADAWRLRLFGTGLRGAPTADDPIEFSYPQLRRLPAESRVAFVECTGNGRSFFASQQGQTVSGTAWKLGAIGVASWRGVRLSTVLRRAGLRGDAVDVMPEGLDPDYVVDGVNLGHVRRPLPIGKALDDVLLVYEMNGRPLPADHGHPVRVLVPSWAGISSVKWVGGIEVSSTPLFSPWNTQYYRLFGPTYPSDGAPVTRQVVKSAFELPWPAKLEAGRTHVLRGRSWSGNGRISHVEVSTDGSTWRRATPVGGSAERGWQRWRLSWRPPAAGSYVLRARATDVTGAGQPDQTPYNSLGYLFDAVVDHPVTVG